MDREGWNQRYGTTELVWTTDPNQFLVAGTSSLAPGTALDLAAGEGRNAVWLARQRWWVTAVDFPDVGLAKAAQLAAVAGVKVAMVCADVVDYTAPPAASTSSPSSTCTCPRHSAPLSTGVLRTVSRREGRCSWSATTPPT